MKKLSLFSENKSNNSIKTIINPNELHGLNFAWRIVIEQCAKNKPEAF